MTCQILNADTYRNTVTVQIGNQRKTLTLNPDTVRACQRLTGCHVSLDVDDSLANPPTKIYLNGYWT